MSQHELQVLKQQINQAFLIRFSPVLVDLYADQSKQPNSSIELGNFVYQFIQDSKSYHLQVKDMQGVTDDSMWLLFNLVEINFKEIHSLFTSSTPAQQGLISFKEDLWL